MQQYEGSTLDERYLLKRVVDAGNFGAVFDAVDKKFNSRVAVKILFESHVDSGTFRSEALLARQFRHPNVVEVYDFGEDEEHEVAFIVMEFLQGLRSDQLMAEQQFQPRLFCRFVDHIGSALHTAHSRSLIHRDLKPQNIMLLDRSQPTERFVLLDLGVASKSDSMTTLRNKALDGAMSPQYASPEQVESRDVDFRSDVYSFGTILFEWLTGEPPFQADQLIGLANAICNKEPPYPSDLTDREIHPDVEKVVLDCLHKNPARRPASIAEVRSRVLTALAPETLENGSLAPLVGVPHTDQPTDSTANPNAQTIAPPGQQGLAGSGADQFAVTEVGAGLGARGSAVSGSEATQHTATTQRDAPAWQGTERRSGEKRSAWPLRLALLAIVVLTAFIVSRMMPGQGPLRLETPDTLSVESGSELNATASVLGDEVEHTDFEILNVPDWLQVDHTDGPATSSLRFQAALISSAEDATITVRATADGQTLEHPIVIKLIPPDIKIPSGFEAVGETLVRNGAFDTIVPERIAKQVGKDRVEFVLIHEPISGLVPYYIMENKVWNALVVEFAKANPDKLPAVEDGTGWQLGAIANGQSMGVLEYPRLPVMGLTALEAHDFARWIGGPMAHLPSTEQWELAAGASRDHANTEWSKGPFRKVTGESLGVAINRAADGPRKVGEARNDISPLGIRDIAGNGEELTSTTDNGTVPNCNPNANVFTRGRSYVADKPLTWAFLEAIPTSTAPLTLGVSDRHPEVSFRVVIDTEGH